MPERIGPAPPKLFIAVGTRRGLVWLAVLCAAAGAAMLPAMATMSNHGARAQEILDGWGDAGRAAMWWQLGLDIPFILGFGLFFAGACAAIWRRAVARSAMPRLERAALFAVWLGPLAALADLTQDLSSAVMLAGHVTQPWPRLSSVSVSLVLPLLGVAAVFALGGYLAGRRRAAPRPS